MDTTAWLQTNPSEPVLKDKKEGDRTTIDFKNINEKIDPEWRFFARSASDSKGPAIALISALQILHSKKIKPELNIKVIMDFQEELGSPDLPKAVEKIEIYCEGKCCLSWMEQGIYLISQH